MTEPLIIVSNSIIKKYPSFYIKNMSDSNCLIMDNIGRTIIKLELVYGTTLRIFVTTNLKIINFVKDRSNIEFSTSIEMNHINLLDWLKEVLILVDKLQVSDSL